MSGENAIQESPIQLPERFEKNGWGFGFPFRAGSERNVKVDTGQRIRNDLEQHSKGGFPDVFVLPSRHVLELCAMEIVCDEESYAYGL